LTLSQLICNTAAMLFFQSFSLRSSLTSVLAVSFAALASAGESAKAPATTAPASVEDPLGYSFGGILYPHFHAHGAFGESTGDPARLALGHPDPKNNGFTLQGLEVGLSGRFTDWLETFAIFNLSYSDAEDEWEHEFEEWFAKIKDLPGGFELRGGKFLNRVGLHNTVHLHAWDWADQYLVNGRFLGDDGLRTLGGEVTWTVPTPWTSLIMVGFGEAPEHEEEEGAHGESEEALYEGEAARFNDLFTTVNWTNQFNTSDFHQFRAGASGAWGDNEFGRQSAIYGIHFEYLWRQNGLEAGGNYFRWRSEAMVRRFGAISGELHGEEEEEGEHSAEEEEHEEEAEGRRATLSEAGFYTDLRYGWETGLEVGLRGEWLEGVGDAGLDERFRLSPGVTYYLNGKRTVMFRVQYNYDHSSDFGDEHSVWAQIGFNLGGPEVR
jgi:hypothetical protein